MGKGDFTIKTRRHKGGRNCKIGRNLYWTGFSRAFTVTGENVRPKIPKMSKVLYNGQLPIWVFIILGFMFGGFCSLLDYVQTEKFNPWLLAFGITCGVTIILIVRTMVIAGRNPGTPVRRNIKLIAKIGGAIIAVLTLIKILSEQ